MLVQYQSGKLKTTGDFDSVSFGNLKVIYSDTKSDKDYVTKSKDGLSVSDLIFILQKMNIDLYGFHIPERMILLPVCHLGISI